MKGKQELNCHTQFSSATDINSIECRTSILCLM